MRTLEEADASKNISSDNSIMEHRNQELYYVSTSVVDRFFRLLSWKDHETIIDMGMGDGRFTVKGLLPKLPKDITSLIGSDYSSSNVEYAAKKYKADPRVKFIELDISTKNLPDDFHGKFDHLFSFFALNWVYDLKQAMKNMYNMMKPGAEFLILVVEKGVDKMFYNFSINPRWASYGHEKYIPDFFGKQDRLPVWKKLLTDTGFVDLNCFREYVVCRQKNRKACEDIFKSINPMMAKIPHEDLDDYHKDYVTELFRTNLCSATIERRTKEERITTNFADLIIYGKKPLDN